MKNKVRRFKKGLILLVVLFAVVLLSVGYSAFNTKLNITGIVFNVRPTKDIRITGLSVVPEGVSSDASITYTDYNVNRLLLGVKLPNKDSSIKYKVEITNLGDIEGGISSIDNLPDDLTYELEGYELKQKICNKNNECSLGIKKEFYITIKYKSSSTVTDKEYNLNLLFVFKRFYDVSYSGIELLSSVCQPASVTTGNSAKGAYDIGDEYLCNVAPEKKYRFLVVSEEARKVNLILQRNIFSDGSLATEAVGNASSSVYSLTTWHDSPIESISYGPVTAMQFVHNATKNWSNLDNIVLDYNDENNQYGSIKTKGNITSITTKDGSLVTAQFENLKARLPMLSEVMSPVGSCKHWVDSGINNGSCKLWLVDYLLSGSFYSDTNKTSIANMYGYWLMAANDTYSNSALYVDFNGIVGNTNSATSGYYGIRPVISVSKSTPSELGFPDEIIAGENIRLELGVNAPLNIIVYVDGVTTGDYTYKNGVLEISNISGNLKVIASF